MWSGGIWIINKFSEICTAHTQKKVRGNYISDFLCFEREKDVLVSYQE